MEVYCGPTDAVLCTQPTHLQQTIHSNSLIVIITLCTCLHITNTHDKSDTRTTPTNTINRNDGIHRVEVWLTFVGCCKLLKLFCTDISNACCEVSANGRCNLKLYNQINLLICKFIVISTTTTRKLGKAQREPAQHSVVLDGKLCHYITHAKVCPQTVI